MPKNITASIAARLRNKSQELGLSFDYLLRRYAAERFLFRISQTPLRENLVLKGGALFFLWSGDIALARPTMDTDFLCTTPLTMEILRNALKDVFEVVYEEDGLIFDASTLNIQDIRSKEAYGGYEFNLVAYLGNIRIPVQVDIGLGDCITPQPCIESFPKLLDHLSPANLLTYPKETVLAEKLEAMVSIGLANSRMKDFYDVWSLFHTNILKSPDLLHAIRQTFRRRKTKLPIRDVLPLCFTNAFYGEIAKQKQWTAYLKRNHLSAPNLEDVIVEIAKIFFTLLETSEVQTI